MKYLFLIILLNFFTMCNSQKQPKSTTENGRIPFSKEFIFFADNYGGSKKPSFSFIKSQKELDMIMGENQFYGNHQKTTKNKLKFPENQQVIKYNLGYFSSGSHTPRKIDSFRVHNDTLELYIIDENKKNDDFGIGGTVAIQVISEPYIIFSVPKNLKFTNITLKYE